MLNKYLFAVLTAFLSFACPSHAQFSVGLTGGLNISQLHVSDAAYKGYVDKLRPGFTVGPTLTYRANKTGFGLDASALFDIRGAKSKSYDNCDPVYNYSAQIPVNLRYGINFQEMVCWFIFAGPQFGFNFNKERHLAYGTGSSTGHSLERRWVNDATTLSCNVGIGAVVLDHVQVRVSYNFALKNSSRIEQLDLVDASPRTLTGARSNACQVTLSYLF